MSRTLRYGSNAEPRLSSRIDRFIVRRNTTVGYDRVMELAQLDYARHVAAEVTPKMAGMPQVRYASNAPGFGKRS